MDIVQAGHLKNYKSCFEWTQRKNCFCAGKAFIYTLFLMVNFFGIMQNEWASDQVDIYLEHLFILKKLVINKLNNVYNH